MHDASRRPDCISNATFACACAGPPPHGPSTPACFKAVRCELFFRRHLQSHTPTNRQHVGPTEGSLALTGRPLPTLKCTPSPLPPGGGGRTQAACVEVPLVSWHTLPVRFYFRGTLSSDSSFKRSTKQAVPLPGESAMRLFTLKTDHQRTGTDIRRAFVAKCQLFHGSQRYTLLSVSAKGAIRDEL